MTSDRHRYVSREPQPGLAHVPAQCLVRDSERRSPAGGTVRPASHITVHFPWGSLLTGGSKVIGNLSMIAQPGATLSIVLNSSALLKDGLSLEQVGSMVRQALHMSGFDVKTPVMLDAEALRRYPTTWAKRLGYGRDPKALSLSAISPGNQEHFWRVQAFRALERR